MPACGVSPEAMAKAIASGSATRPTVMPAMTSCKNLFRLYSRRHRTDLGNQRSPQAEERIPDMNSIMTGTRFFPTDPPSTKAQCTIHFGASRAPLQVRKVSSPRLYGTASTGGDYGRRGAFRIMTKIRTRRPRARVGRVRVVLLWQGCDSSRHSEYIQRGMYAVTKQTRSNSAR